MERLIVRRDLYQVLVHPDFSNLFCDQFAFLAYWVHHFCPHFSFPLYLSHIKTDEKIWLTGVTALMGRLADRVAPVTDFKDCSATPRLAFDSFVTRFMPLAGSRSICLLVNSYNVDLCLSGCELL